MPYLKAENHLPPDLVIEIQKYVHGVQIYIPGKSEERKKWGEKNGTKDKLRSRNAQIVNLKNNGHSINDLADYFHLSADSIKKIVYRKSQ